MSSEFQNRLRKNLEQPAPAQHPAPDVLSAYAEHTLGGAEEQQVIAHLAACAECREVVYLASAAEEEPVTVAPKAAAPSRLRWWTWAVPVAAVLAVGTTVLVFRTKEPAASREYLQFVQPSAPPSQPMAVETRPDARAVAAPRATVPPAKQLAKAKEELARPQVANKRLVLDAEKEKDDKSVALVAKNEPSGAIGGAIAAAPQRMANQAATGAAAVARDRVAAAPAAPAAENTTVAVSAEQVMPAYADAQQAESAKKAAAPSSFAAGNVMMRQRPVMKAAVPAPWAVTSAGGLERFEGKVWQPVKVDASAFFLTVTNVGNDVWVGGKNGVLLHSSDDGATWERETLPGDKARDIVHVEFHSALEGLLKTSAGDAFTTHDGGKTWTIVPSR